MDKMTTYQMLLLGILTVSELIMITGLVRLIINFIKNKSNYKVFEQHLSLLGYTGFFSLIILILYYIISQFIEI